MCGTLPRGAQARLARSVGNSDDEGWDSNPQKGLTPAGRYAVSATSAFTLVAGLTTFPPTIIFGGNAWATALVPLTGEVLLAYLLYRRA